MNELNWLAIIAATIAYYLLAALWFSEMAFYPAWRRSIGWEKQRLGLIFYFGPLVTCFATVVALAVLFKATRTSTLVGGTLLGLLVGIGIVAPVLYNAGALDPKKPHPMTWFGVTAGYHLVGVLIASVILSLWQ